MEFYIFDEYMQLLATVPITNKVEMEWQEKLYESDSVSIKITYDNVSDIFDRKYGVNKNLFESLESIYTKTEDGKEYLRPRFLSTNIFDENNIRVCYIESYSIDELGRTLEIEGVGIMRLLDYRYTYEREYIPTEQYSDTVGQVACRFINDYISVDPVLSKILVAEEGNNIAGPDVFFMTEFNDKVYDKLSDLLGAYNLGYSANFNRSRGLIEFIVIDTSNNIPKEAVSADDGNLEGNDYSFDMSNYFNYIQAGAVYEYDDETEIVIQEKVDNSNGGLIMAMAVDIDKNQYSLSVGEYRDLIKQEAEAELKLNTVTETYDIDISDDVNLNLGDSAVCKVYLGYKEMAKITTVTEVKHSVQGESNSRELTFDSPHNITKELKKILGVK